MAKRIMAFLSALMLLGVIVGFVLVTRAEAMLAEAPVVTKALLPGAGDVAHGEHLVKNVLACGACHALDLGGEVMVESPLIGRISAPNVTQGKGGIGAKSVHEWDLAVRHGIANHRALLLMPSEGYSRLSAQDMRDVAAYLAVMPKVDRTVSRTELRPLGAFLVLKGAFHAEALTLSHQNIDMGDTGVALTRGEYLLEVSGCRGCHGPELRGREVAPGKPRAVDISKATLAPWSLEQFSNAVRKGQARDGRALDPMMPSRVYTAMSDDDLRALYETLHGP